MPKLDPRQPQPHLFHHDEQPELYSNDAKQVCELINTTGRTLPNAPEDAVTICRTSKEAILSGIAPGSQAKNSISIRNSLS